MSLKINAHMSEEYFIADPKSLANALETLSDKINSLVDDGPMHGAANLTAKCIVFNRDATVERIYVCITDDKS